MILRHHGPVAPSSIEIDSEEFQPWRHSKEYIDFANLGVELLFPYDDVIIRRQKAKKPFVQVSAHYYLLETEILLVPPDGYDLLILPHYKYYTDLTWSTPLPVAAASSRDWFPFQLSILFRFPSRGEVKFEKNKPFAQAIAVRRQKQLLVPLNTKEKEDKKNVAESIDKDKYITRRWVTSGGYAEDNLYNVLSYLDEIGKLPIKKDIKKYKVIKCCGQKSKKRRTPSGINTTSVTSL